MNKDNFLEEIAPYEGCKYEIDLEHPRTANVRYQSDLQELRLTEEQG